MAHEKRWKCTLFTGRPRSELLRKIHEIAKVVKSKSNDEWLSGDSRALRALTREIHATLQHVVCSVERSALEKGARDVWEVLAPFVQRVLDRGAPAIETPERDAFEAAEDAMVLMPFLDVAAPVPAETLLEHLRGRTETTLLSVNPKGIASKGIAKFDPHCAAERLLHEAGIKQTAASAATEKGLVQAIPYIANIGQKGTRGHLLVMTGFLASLMIETMPCPEWETTMQPLLVAAGHGLGWMDMGAHPAHTSPCFCASTDKENAGSEDETLLLDGICGRGSMACANDLMANWHRAWQKWMLRAREGGKSSMARTIDACVEHNLLCHLDHGIAYFVSSARVFLMRNLDVYGNWEDGIAHRTAIGEAIARPIDALAPIMHYFGHGGSLPDADLRARMAMALPKLLNQLAGVFESAAQLFHVQCDALFAAEKSLEKSSLPQLGRFLARSNLGVVLEAHAEGWEAVQRAVCKVVRSIALSIPPQADTAPIVEAFTSIFRSGLMHILVRFASFDSALKIERQEDPELIDVLTPFDCLSCMLGAFQSSPQSTTSDPMSASPRDLRDMSEETIKCLLQGQYDSFRRGSQRDQMAVAMLECGLLDDVVESIGCVHAEVLRCSEELDDAPREGAKRPGTVAGVMGMTLMELLAKIAHTSAAAKAFKRLKPGHLRQLVDMMERIEKVLAVRHLGTTKPAGLHRSRAGRTCMHKLEDSTAHQSRQAASLFCILSQEVAGPKVGGFQKDLLPVIARCSTIANMTTVGAGSLASVSACFRCAHCGKWDRSLRPSEHGCGCTNVAIADGPFGACDACRAVFYCSRTCQSLHWPMHMGECAGRVDVPGVAWWKKGRDARETDANKQPRADVRDSGGLANGKENAGARVGAAKVGPLGMGGNRANVQAGEALGKQRAAGKRWRGCNCEFCVTFGWRGEGEGEGEDTEDEDEVEDTEDEDESDDDAEGEALSAVISASYEKAAQKARLASALMTEGPLECVQQ